MTEPTPEYQVTMDVIVIRDSWEAQLIARARAMREEWLRNPRRKILLMAGCDGEILLFWTDTAGRIETS